MKAEENEATLVRVSLCFTLVIVPQTHVVSEEPPAAACVCTCVYDLVVGGKKGPAVSQTPPFQLQHLCAVPGPSSPVVAINVHNASCNKSRQRDAKPNPDNHVEI